MAALQSGHLKGSVAQYHSHAYDQDSSENASCGRVRSEGYIMSQSAPVEDNHPHDRRSTIRRGYVQDRARPGLHASCALTPAATSRGISRKHFSADGPVSEHTGPERSRSVHNLGLATKKDTDVQNVRKSGRDHSVYRRNMLAEAAGGEAWRGGPEDLSTTSSHFLGDSMRSLQLHFPSHQPDETNNSHHGVRHTFPGELLKVPRSYRSVSDGASVRCEARRFASESGEAWPSQGSESPGLHSQTANSRQLAVREEDDRPRYVAPRSAVSKMEPAHPRSKYPLGSIRAEKISHSPRQQLGGIGLHLPGVSQHELRIPPLEPLLLPGEHDLAAGARAQRIETKKQARLSNGNGTTQQHGRISFVDMRADDDRDHEFHELSHDPHPPSHPSPPATRTGSILRPAKAGRSGRHLRTVLEVRSRLGEENTAGSGSPLYWRENRSTMSAKGSTETVSQQGQLGADTLPKQERDRDYHQDRESRGNRSKPLSSSTRRLEIKPLEPSARPRFRAQDSPKGDASPDPTTSFSFTEHSTSSGNAPWAQVQPPVWVAPNIEDDPTLADLAGIPASSKASSGRGRLGDRSLSDHDSDGNSDAGGRLGILEDSEGVEAPRLRLLRHQVSMDTAMTEDGPIWQGGNIADGLKDLSAEKRELEGGSVSTISEGGRSDPTAGQYPATASGTIAASGARQARPRGAADSDSDANDETNGRWERQSVERNDQTPPLPGDDHGSDTDSQPEPSAIVHTSSLVGQTQGISPGVSPGISPQGQRGLTRGNKPVSLSVGVLPPGIARRESTEELESPSPTMAGQLALAAGFAAPLAHRGSMLSGDGSVDSTGGKLAEDLLQYSERTKAAGRKRRATIGVAEQNQMQAGLSPVMESNAADEDTDSTERSPREAPAIVPRIGQAEQSPREAPASVPRIGQAGQSRATDDGGSKSTVASSSAVKGDLLPPRLPPTLTQTRRSVTAGLPPSPSAKGPGSVTTGRSHMTRSRLRRNTMAVPISFNTALQGHSKRPRVSHVPILPQAQLQASWASLELGNQSTHAAASTSDGVAFERHRRQVVSGVVSDARGAGPSTESGSGTGSSSGSLRERESPVVENQSNGSNIMKGRPQQARQSLHPELDLMLHGLQAQSVDESDTDDEDGASSQSSNGGSRVAATIAVPSQEDAAKRSRTQEAMANLGRAMFSATMDSSSSVFSGRESEYLQNSSPAGQSYRLTDTISRRSLANEQPENASTSHEESWMSMTDHDSDFARKTLSRRTSSFLPLNAEASLAAVALRGQSLLRSRLADDDAEETQFEWKLGPPIGSGSFGSVHRALVTGTGRQVAVKRIALPVEFQKQWLAATAEFHARPLLDGTVDEQIAGELRSMLTRRSESTDEAQVEAQSTIGSGAFSTEDSTQGSSLDNTKLRNLWIGGRGAELPGGVSSTKPRRRSTSYESNPSAFHALKKILRHSQSKAAIEVREVLREVDMLRRLQHRHIVQYMGARVDAGGGHLDVVMELVDGGTLSRMLQDFGALDEQLASATTRQLLLGLRYLHDRYILHSDLKPANALLTASAVVKLADFGCARRIGGLVNDTSLGSSDSERSSQIKAEGGKSGAAAAGQSNDGKQPGVGGDKRIRGTLPYMAPESIRNEQTGLPSDIWSVGCTVLEMLTGVMPWIEQFDHPLALMFHVGKTGEAPEIPATLSEEAQDFLRSCMRKDPEDRLNVKALLRHPWIVRHSKSSKRGLSSVASFRSNQSKGGGATRGAQRYGEGASTWEDQGADERDSVESSSEDSASDDLQAARGTGGAKSGGASVRAVVGMMRKMRRKREKAQSALQGRKHNKST